MAMGVRLEPDLEQQLDQLAERKGKSRSACVRDAIAQYVSGSAKPMKPCGNRP